MFDMNQFSLKGKVALVTGGGRGIGQAIAFGFAKAGAKVAITSRKAPDLEATACTMDEVGCETLVVPAHLGRLDEIQRVVDTVVQKFGRLDILVNNAGIGIMGKTVEQITPDEFRQTVETNLFGVYYACHYAVPLMKKRGGGYIINISSLAGQNAHPKMAAYNASKFGLNGFSEALMQEVRQDDIKVSYICPGSVNTYFGNDTPSAEKAWQIQPEDIAEVVIDLLKMDARTLPSKVEIRPSKPPVR